MAFAQTYTKVFTVLGGKVVTGNFALTLTSTTGTINTGLSQINYAHIYSTSGALIAPTSTFPKAGGGIAMTTTTGVSGYFWAIGQ